MNTPPDPQALITVTVKQEPVFENGRQYLKGQKLQVSPVRAAELGSFIVLPPQPKPVAPAPAAAPQPPPPPAPVVANPTNPPAPAAAQK